MRGPVLKKEAREPENAVVRSAARAALLHMVPRAIFHASVVAVASGESPADALVTYTLAGRSGVLRLCGAPPIVLKTSDWRPARRALRMVLCAIGVVAMAVEALRQAYCSQHEWFARYGHGGVAGVLGLIGVIALVPAVYGALLPREAWSARTLWIPTLVAVGFALAASISCHIGGPSLHGALSRLQSGDEPAALMEARALIAFGIDARGGHTLLDTLHLQQARRARSVDEIAAPLGEIWYDAAVRAGAIALLNDRVRDDAAAAYTAGDAAALERIAATSNSLRAGLGATPSLLAKLVQARACGEQSDWACATADLGAASASPEAELAAARDAVTDGARHELQRLAATAAPSGDLRAQRDRLAAMLAAAKCITDLTGKPALPSVSALQAALTPVQQQVAWLEKREAATAEAKRQRQETQEKQRQEQQAAAQRSREAQEHEASRAVLCSDGSYSGCLCHADSHRGCCSHHGGIAGCAP